MVGDSRENWEEGEAEDEGGDPKASHKWSRSEILELAK